MIHFEYYPTIEYSNNTAKNILVRGKIRDVVLQNGALYYKYTVEDHMKPEIISHKYYGSPNYVWAIYYANNIFDPVNEWVKNSADFEKYIKQKYGTVEGAIRLNNPDGTINYDNVHHFIEVDSNDKKVYVIDRKTFDTKRAQGANNVKAITHYEYEKELNDKKRDIIILDRAFLSKILNEIRNLFVEA